MPGLKRKATASSSSVRAKPSLRSRYQDPNDSDDAGNFDDDEDLLASALTGTGSAAIPDNDDDQDTDTEASSDQEEDDDLQFKSGSDEEEDSDEDDHGNHVETMSDEDMNGGFEDLEDNEEDTPTIDPSSSSSKRNGSKKSLYAIPTNAEMQGLKETSELFKNNVFKLKIDEMLPEVRPNYGKAGALELVLRRLHQLFESLEALESAPAGEAVRSFEQRTKGQIKIPFPDPAPKSDAQYKLAFEKPASMHLVGSWPLKCATTRPEGVDIDVAVVMPSSLFQDKDYANFRYFHKKAFYLAALANAIATSSTQHNVHLGVTPSFALLDADPRKPVLVLTPVHDKSETDFSKLKACIRIHPAVASDIFKPARLGPLRSNVRVGVDNAADASIPTPRYNSVILSDTLHLPHLVYLHTTAQACPAFADACLLLKTWAFQRGFGSGERTRKRNTGGESHRCQVAGSGPVRFLLTMILAHLLNGEEKFQDGAKRDPTAARSKLTNGFSSYQLFRGVMDWLAKHDLQSNPVFMKPMPSAGLESRSDKVARADFAEAFDRVLVDPSGSLNLLALMPTGSVDLLQYEAQKTLEMLMDASTDYFDALFLQDRTAAPFTFDEVARLHLPVSSKRPRVQDGDAEQQAPATLAATLKADFGTSVQAAMMQVSSTASKALHGRAKLVALLHSSSGGLLDSWALNSSRPTPSSDVEVGMVLDAEQAWRMVEHGPSSQDTDKAQDFRAFWGKLSELRRFKDGRVLESVVWPVTSQDSRWTIPRRILSYVLYRHHAIHESQISFVSAKFDKLLSVDDDLSRKAYLISPEEKGFTLIQTAFEQLSKDLRALESLPLSIISIAPSSAGIRGTSTFVPAPMNLAQLGRTIPDVASYLELHDIVLTFEGSGKWPNDLGAIQAMKAAFFERMCGEITKKIAGCTCKVVFDAHASSKMEDQCGLEIVLASGFAFRARVMHNRERVLLERILADKFESTGAKRRAKGILNDWERRFESAPLHHSYIASMGHRFASFGGAVRLTKRWIASQMLSTPTMPEELLELVCAAAYLSPEQGAPASAVAGFLGILRLLATWRWKEEPLMVPIQAVIDASEARQIYTFPAEKRTEVARNFQAARGSDPSMAHRAWYVATETDLHGAAFGNQGPVGGVADGVQKLARSAVKILEDATLMSSEQVLALFTPSLAHYDFLVHLDSRVLSRYMENLQADSMVWGKKKAKYVNLETESTESVPSVLGSEPRPGFDAAAAFLALLRSLYSDSFRLFHDTHGGAVIGGLFNPVLDRPRDFKVGLGFNNQPEPKSGTNSKTHVRLNKAALIAEIERLGVGLVERVELRN